MFKMTPNPSKSAPLPKREKGLQGSSLQEGFWTPLVWWRYRALSQQGERFKGYRQARGATLLARDLMDEDLHLISCRRVWWKRKATTPQQKELQDFTRHMAALLKTGFSLEEALESYKGSASFQSLARDLLRGIQKGQTFSRAFQERVSIKKSLVLVFMTVAEKRGDLGLGFENLTTHLQEKNDMKQKLISSLGYPLFLCFMIFALISFLFTEIMPQLEVFLSSSGAKMPLSSRALMVTAEIISEGAMPILALVLGAVFFLGVVAKLSQQGAIWIEEKAIKVPLIGPIAYQRERLVFLQNFRLLLGSGVPLLEALTVSKEGNAAFFQNAIEKASQDIVLGLTLYQAFEKQHCLDDRSLRFIKTGEITGRLPVLLKDLTELLKTDIDRKSERLMALLEPASLVFVGVILLWIVSAFFLPLYENLNEAHF